MSTTYGGSYRSYSFSLLRRRSHPAARRQVGRIRRRPASDRSVLLASQRPHGPVQMSEWRGVLETLQQLPMVAAGGTTSSLVGGPVETPGRVHVGTAVNDAPPSLPPFAAVPLERDRKAEQ